MMQEALQVVQKLAGGRLDRDELHQMDFNVRRLAESLPEFLTFETRAEQGELVRMKRSLDTKSLRDKLVALSRMM